MHCEQADIKGGGGGDGGAAAAHIPSTLHVCPGRKGRQRLNLKKRPLVFPLLFQMQKGGGGDSDDGGGGSGMHSLSSSDLLS